MFKTNIDIAFLDRKVVGRGSVIRDERAKLLAVCLRRRETTWTIEVVEVEAAKFSA